MSLATVALGFCYVIAGPFLEPIFLAIILAVVVYPAHRRWVVSRIRNPNQAALVSTLAIACLSLLVTVGLTLGITNEVHSFYLLIKEQSGQPGGFFETLSHTFERARLWLGQYVDMAQFDLRATVLGQAEQISKLVLAQTANVLGNIVAVVVEAVITFLTLFFFLRDGRAIWRRLSVWFPLRRDQVEKLSTGVSSMITASVYGMAAVGAAQGTLTCIAFVALGLPSPILWGVVAGAFSLIPLVGSSVIWVPTAIILFLTGHWIKAIIMLAWGALVIGMADNVIRPIILSGSTKTSYLLTFFALLGGVRAFGLIGLFLGPLVLALTQTLFQLLQEEGNWWAPDTPDDNVTE